MHKNIILLVSFLNLSQWSLLTGEYMMTVKKICCCMIILE